jgi:exonuclease VII small subunit
MTIAEGVSLRDYVDTRLAAAEKALEVALVANEKRLDAMNEFRATLKDQAATFITRADLQACIGSLEASVDSLKESRALLEGKASQLSVDWVRGLALVSIGLSLLGLAISLLK